MSDMEKITIKMHRADLERVDHLVEDGSYTSRDDFIHTAIGHQLDQQRPNKESAANRKSMVIGTLVYDRKTLEGHRARNEKVNVKVIGMLILSEDIPPELALETIDSITIRGVIRAPETLKSVLADRLH